MYDAHVDKYMKSEDSLYFNLKNSKKYKQT